MRALILVAIAVALAGCYAEPTARTGTDNPDVPVETLFTHDGCTMYRFYDGGRHVHFAKCGSTASTSERVSCGKNCTREQFVVAEGGAE